MATFPSFTECDKPADGTYPNVSGVEPQKAFNSENNGARSSIKNILYRGWRGRLADPTRTAIGGFRFYNNAGDPLSRKHYSGVQNSRECVSQLGGGIGNMHQPRCMRGRSQRNTSGVETFSGNPNFVYDSSNYITYRKQKALNKGYGTVSGRVYTDGGGSRCTAVAARRKARH